LGALLPISVPSHDDKHLGVDGDFLALGQMTAKCLTKTWRMQKRNVGVQNGLSRRTNADSL
jgi:hypothetical protein